MDQKIEQLPLPVSIESGLHQPYQFRFTSEFDQDYQVSMPLLSHYAKTTRYPNPISPMVISDQLLYIPESFMQQSIKDKYYINMHPKGSLLVISGYDAESYDEALRWGLGFLAMYRMKRLFGRDPIDAFRELNGWAEVGYTTFLGVPWITRRLD